MQGYIQTTQNSNSLIAMGTHQGDFNFCVRGSPHRGEAEAEEEEEEEDREAGTRKKD